MIDASPAHLEEVSRALRRRALLVRSDRAEPLISEELTESASETLLFWKLQESRVHAPSREYE